MGGRPAPGRSARPQGGADLPLGARTIAGCLRLGWLTCGYIPDLARTSKSSSRGDAPISVVSFSVPSIGLRTIPGSVAQIWVIAAWS
jgi:hypothetical protein